MSDTLIDFQLSDGKMNLELHITLSDEHGVVFTVKDPERHPEDTTVAHAYLAIRNGTLHLDYIGDRALEQDDDPESVALYNREERKTYL